MIDFQHVILKIFTLTLEALKRGFVFRHHLRTFVLPLFSLGAEVYSYNKCC